MSKTKQAERDALQHDLDKIHKRAETNGIALATVYDDGEKYSTMFTGRVFALKEIVLHLAHDIVLIDKEKEPNQ